MAAIILSQVATNMLAGPIYGVLAEGASLGAAGPLWGVSQGLAGFAGSTVGSVIDRALFGGAQNQEGPLLSDLSAQSSADGAALPKVYGTFRMAGNVVWSTGLQEVRHEEDVGGGSGGGGGSVTTYTYQTDLAVAICEGEITGIRRIWADTKLIYDVGDTAGVASLIASSSRAAAIRVYPGDEAQAPDPLIQAVEGAAATPAYRGTAYVVFEDLQLADFGNRIPNFQFEVVTGGSVATTVFEYADPFVPVTSGYYTKAPTYDADGLHIIECYGTQWNHWLFIPGTAAPIFIERQDIVASGLENYLGGISDYSDSVGKFMPSGAYWTTGYWWAGYDSKGAFGQVTFTIGASWHLACAEKVGNLYLAAGTDPSGYIKAALNGTPLPGMPVALGVATMCGITASYLQVFDNTYKLIYRFDHIGQFVDSFASTCTYTLVRFMSDTTAIIDEAGAFSLLDYSNTASPAKTLLFNSSAIHTSSATNTQASIFEAGADLYVGFRSNYGPVTRAAIVVDRMAAGTAALDDVVGDLLQSGGLAAGDVDVSDISLDTVRGYTVSRPMSMRSAIEPLMAAYHFDLIEEDGKVVAVKRGGSTVATLDVGILGAAESPGAVPVVLTRNNPTELPSEIAVSYPDPGTEYQLACQYARRLTCLHTNRLALTLPLVMTSQEAARLAESLLNAAWWSSRESYAMSATFDALRLSPSDLVDLPAYGATVSARLTEVTLGAPGIMQIKASPDLPALYSGTAVGADAVDMAQLVSIAGPTRAMLLDSVALRDQDTAHGMYVAMGGYTAGWPGGVLYRSLDGGATWNTAVVGTSGTAATMGYATTVLADDGCTTWDHTNTVTIKLYAGATLSSATEDAILNGANAALIGATGRWELLQFQTATLNGDGTYTLSKLLRGRKGTDHASASHAAYDAIVLLSAAAIQDMPLASGELSVTRDYKGVTSGSSLEATSSSSVSYTGERLECLSPVDLRASRDGSGNITLTWIRRDRINAGWHDYSDVPMSEATESYEVDIYTSGTYGTVKRTLTGLSSQTASYTSAQQVTDFGSNQSTIYVRVYQLSATVGRGHYRQGAV